MEKNFCVIAGRTIGEWSFGADESHSDCIALKLTLANKIAELCSAGISDFVCNCEWGTALWAGEVVIAMRAAQNIKLHIVMPTESQANRYTNEMRERFFNLHAAADSVTMPLDEWHAKRLSRRIFKDAMTALSTERERQNHLVAICFPNSAYSDNGNST